MKKESIITILISFLLVFIASLILLYFYQKEQNITIYAEVLEVSNNNYLVKPLPNEKIKDNIKININDNFKESDILILTIKKSTMEVVTYELYKTSDVITTTLKTETTTTTPASDEELSVNITNENEVIDTFNGYLAEVNNSTNDESYKNKAKNYFVRMVDFIFYEKEISGYKFNELTNSAKLKVISIALELDKSINNLFPNYKNELSKDYKNAKNRLITFYLESTTEFCTNYDVACTEAKNNFLVLKKSLNLTWSFITSIKDASVKELQSWYEIFSGK